MTEISKVDLLKIDARLKSRGVKNDGYNKDKDTFEDQLLQTVKKLETMGNEIDAMMESSLLHKGSEASGTSKPGSKLDKQKETIVENFSAAKKSSVKSAKDVASYYEKINKSGKTS